VITSQNLQFPSFSIAQIKITSHITTSGVKKSSHRERFLLIIFSVSQRSRGALSVFYILFCFDDFSGCVGDMSFGCTVFVESFSHRKIQICRDEMMNMPCSRSHYAPCAGEARDLYERSHAANYMV
jgi:hypothetical protein